MYFWPLHLFLVKIFFYNFPMKHCFQNIYVLFILKLLFFPTFYFKLGSLNICILLNIWAFYLFSYVTIYMIFSRYVDVHLVCCKCYRQLRRIVWPRHRVCSSWREPLWSPCCQSKQSRLSSSHIVLMWVHIKSVRTCFSKVRTHLNETFTAPRWFICSQSPSCSLDSAEYWTHTCTFMNVWSL